MIVSNQKFSRIAYLALMFCFIIVGCNPDSSGAKETEQLNNDNDPTAIEKPKSRDPLLLQSQNSLDDQGEFVVIQNFSESDWSKISQDFNLSRVDNSTITTINSKNIGADGWKPWGEYQYRVIYFSESGSLKAKPILKNKDNSEVEFSNQLVDSLKMEDLWNEIQRRSFAISNDYK